MEEKMAKTMRVAADIPKDSDLAKNILRERDTTGRNITDIVRDALIRRYAKMTADGFRRNGMLED
jgi:hypothetical protein